MAVTNVINYINFAWQSRYNIDYQLVGVGCPQGIARNFVTWLRIAPMAALTLGCMLASNGWVQAW
jgi:hypothetical protein